VEAYCHSEVPFLPDPGVPAAFHRITVQVLNLAERAGHLFLVDVGSQGACDEEVY
jgi:hypothetical protein